MESRLSSVFRAQKNQEGPEKNEVSNYKYLLSTGISDWSWMIVVAQKQTLSAYHVFIDRFILCSCYNNSLRAK